MKLPISAAISMIALLASTTAFGADVAKVHVGTDEPVKLEHRSDSNSPWELACNAPCDISIPAGDEFRFAATDDANETKPFGLRAPDEKGVYNIEHHKKSAALYHAAPFVLVSAAAVFVAGIVMATVGITKAHGHEADGSREQTNALTGAGTFLIVAGVAGGYWGTSVRINNRYSDASGDVRSLEPAQTNGQSSPLPTRGIAFFVPIFSGRF